MCIFEQSLTFYSFLKKRKKEKDFLSIMQTRLRSILEESLDWLAPIDYFNEKWKKSVCYFAVMEREIGILAL